MSLKVVVTFWFFCKLAGAKDLFIIYLASVVRVTSCISPFSCYFGSFFASHWRYRLILNINNQMLFCAII